MLRDWPPLRLPSACRMLRMTGVLAAVPYPERLYRCEMRAMPMHGTADYWRMQALAHASETPVLVNVSQHYALLADVVSRALEVLPALQRIVVGFWTSFPIRLPPALLDERVLLTAQPAHAAQAELDHGSAELLLIEDRLRRDLTERGDNSIGIALIGQRPSEERFASLVRQTALFSSLEGAPCPQP